MKDFVIVIPVRYDSQRLPGKPLIKILGKEMILRTLEQCKKSKYAKNIYIVTDSKKILNLLKKNNFNSVIMSSKKYVTGTDRIAYFAKKIKAKTYINVQGDEPIINPSDINKIIEFSKKYPSQVINGYSQIKRKKDILSNHIPKVVVNNFKNLIYISRSPIPYINKYKNHVYYKQICIYAFPRKKLIQIYKNKKSPLEKIEDIEILRFVENNINVKMIKMSGLSKAVDTQSDIKEITKIIIKKKNN